MAGNSSAYEKRARPRDTAAPSARASAVRRVEGIRFSSAVAHALLSLRSDRGIACVARRLNVARYSTAPDQRKAPRISRSFLPPNFTELFAPEFHGAFCPANFAELFCPANFAELFCPANFTGLLHRHEPRRVSDINPSPAPAVRCAHTRCGCGSIRSSRLRPRSGRCAGRRSSGARCRESGLRRTWDCRMRVR